MPWNVSVAVFAPDPRVTELVPDPVQVPLLWAPGSSDT